MPATQPKAASKELAKNVKEARVAARAMAALSAADREKALSAMRASLEQQRDVLGRRATAHEVGGDAPNELLRGGQLRLLVIEVDDQRAVLLLQLTQLRLSLHL